MNRNIFKVMALLISAMLLYPANCIAQTEFVSDTEEEEDYYPFDSKATAILKSSTDMAYFLFAQVDKHKNRNENYTISPLSLTNALVMLANGADGNTLKQITDFLGVKNINTDNISKTYSTLNQYLKTVDPGTTFANANSIWIDNKFNVNNDFIQKNKKLFNAKVINQTLATQKTMNDINSWCDKQTNGCIKKALYDIPASDSRMILMNAMYFNSTWVDTFDKDNTKEEYFTNSDGSKSKVMMMHQTTDLRACICNNADMVEFPYGEEGNFYMEIFLPHEGENLDVCLKNLKSEQVEKIENYARNYKVNVSMPRMELRCETSFNNSLKALGMSDAFADNANFSKISNNGLLVSDIHQTTFIKVDEEGTEAASETDEVFKAKGILAQNEPLEFNINRPFLYLIREKTTGTILFMGKVRKL